MEKLKYSATITAILGFLSVLALIFLYMALSDIAKKEDDLTLEWYVAGKCIFVLGVFITSTFVTLGFVLKYFKFSRSN